MVTCADIAIKDRSLSATVSIGHYYEESKIFEELKDSSHITTRTTA